MPEETFTYDNLNRLTVVETNGVPFRIEYDKHGRILTKEQEGFSFRNASFDREHPHAVSRVEAYRRPDYGMSDHALTAYLKANELGFWRGSIGGHDYLYDYYFKSYNLHY